MFQFISIYGPKQGPRQSRMDSTGYPQIHGVSRYVSRVTRNGLQSPPLPFALSPSPNALFPNRLRIRLCTSDHRQNDGGCIYINR